MLSREEEDELDRKFIGQNLMAAARAAFRKLGIDRTDEIVDEAYDQYIETILAEKERADER